MQNPRSVTQAVHLLHAHNVLLVWHFLLVAVAAAALMLFINMLSLGGTKEHVPQVSRLFRLHPVIGCC